VSLAFSRRYALFPAVNPIPPIPADQMEKYSSAMTLSDMEIFVFPELLYSLVLANVLSPKVWAWREDPWFEKIGRMTPYRRVLRLKQFIIDHYEFNLDLDTWGLTTKERELERFRPWMDERTIAQSNALFGYEGDRFYFDLAIRQHFGLDQYNTTVIPYWKTETIEAMDAFRFREGYAMGAGECVSLSTLYAAALFVVCGIPLEKIFLMATPLHSQNFVDVGEGILTNNRRVLTRNMWFNGTELTAKAQRALRHEQVTIVSHSTGHIHVVYPEADIDRAAYRHFAGRLQAFLTAELDAEILANYLRQNSSLQRCFQIEHPFGGKPRYIPAERVYSYEHSSSYKVSDGTRDKLLEEMDEDDFFAYPIEGRIPLNKFETFFRERRVDLDRPEDIERLQREFNCYNARASDIIADIIRFTRLKPRLPAEKPAMRPPNPIRIAPEMSREEIAAYLESIRATHRTADLAFYAHRDMARARWEPFVKAAIERSPVSVKGAEGRSDEDVAGLIAGWPSASIYDGSRMAQPDEVWNYRRGDGLEKAFCLANIWKARHPGDPVAIRSADGVTRTTLGGRTLEWPTAKGLATDQNV
jgi:hypothetical protein